MSLLNAEPDLSRDSFYAATVNAPPAGAALQGDVEADVAVVGGGLAGLSAALDLAQAGRRVVLLEAQRIGFGASGRNGGQAIHGLACDQAVIEHDLGLSAARRIWDMSIEALDLLRQRIRDHAIDCDWQDGYLAVAIGPRKAAALLAATDDLEARYGFAQKRIAKADLSGWIASPRYDAAVHDPRSGHLHPLKYTLGLARAARAAGVTIHEHSAVLRVAQGPTPVLHTATGTVRAGQVLLAGNVYLDGVAPGIEARIMPVGTYIVASQPLAPQRAAALIPCGAAVCDTNFVLDYFRLAPDARHGDAQRLLYGGRVSYSARTPRHLVASMAGRMHRTFPQLAEVGVDHAWGGFVDITMSRAPDFGRLPASGHAANVYYLQGFSGHGVALTGLAGRLVAQAMRGDAERFDLFARLRHRAFPGGRLLRMPSLVLGMAWYRLKDAWL
ncbi:MAG: NAD(P)/FAD-dependent oxidoreductase [Aquabacterium sp.]